MKLDQKKIKVGDLVELQGSMWSSYGREDEIGMILETMIPLGPSADEETFSRVWWSKDSQTKLYKTEHLKVISES
jgi:hypothetical protein